MGNIQVPVNIEDTQTLKLFLDTLTKSVQVVVKDISGLGDALGKVATSVAFDPAFKEFVDETQSLQAEIKQAVEDNLETIELQRNDISYVVEQFGTNYEQNQAAAWYGLTVGAGNTLTGFTIGALDRDTNSYGNEDSVFGIQSDRFYIGRAATTQSELDYLSDKDQDFLTLYDTQNIAIPAFGVDYISSTGRYEIFFNGVVSFNNVDTGFTDGQGNTVIDGGTIDTTNLNTTNLQVQNVSDGSANPSFEIRSDGNAGPSNNANIYGGVLSSGLLISSYLDTSSTRVLTEGTTPSTYKSGPFNFYEVKTVSVSIGTGTSSSISVYGKSYGSGYYSNRISSTSASVKIIAYKQLQFHVSLIYIQKSISNGAWTTIATGNFGEGGDTLVYVDNSAVSASATVRYRVAVTVDAGNTLPVSAAISVSFDNFV